MAHGQAFSFGEGVNRAFPAIRRESRQGQDVPTHWLGHRCPGIGNAGLEIGPPAIAQE